MTALHFKDTTEFSDYMESLGHDLQAAGFPEIGQELADRSRAYEIPMTGYYHELYALLESANALRLESLPNKIGERVELGTNYLAEMLQIPDGKHKR